MNQLLEVRTNIYYHKKVKINSSDPDEFARFQELIFLVDKPTYRTTNEGIIIRERGVEEIRFAVSVESFELLIEHLQNLKKIDESELV